MDLRTSHPRSPNEELVGIVSLARTIDKARAFNANTLDDYHYNCPHDQALFDFLGIDARSFAAKVRDLQSDEALCQWVKQLFLSAKSRAQVNAFNAERRSWAPEPGTESAHYFDELKAQVAPDSDVRTWFGLIDIEEHHGLIPSLA